jgi:hypothetical protein
MFNRFGLWYLATLAPAVVMFKAMMLLAPLDRPVVSIMSMVVTICVLPILPIVMLAVSTALRVDTDALLPVWYRRLFGAVPK